MAARRIHGADGGAVGGIPAENGLQACGAQVVADQESREPGDAVPGERGVAHRLRVRRTEATVNGHRAYVPVDRETPIDRASTVNEMQAAIPRQFLDVLWNAMRSQVIRRSTGDHAMRCQKSRHKRM